MNSRVGRPTNYNPKYCQMVIEHMASGLSKEAFCGAIGIAKQTLYNWMRGHKEFLDAVHIGEAKSLYFWEKKGIEGMWLGGKFNFIVWKFNIQNRHGWKEKSDITSDDKPIGIPAPNRLLGGDSNVLPDNSNK